MQSRCGVLTNQVHYFLLQSSISLKINCLNYHCFSFHFIATLKVTFIYVGLCGCTGYLKLNNSGEKVQALQIYNFKDSFLLFGAHCVK